MYGYLCGLAILLILLTFFILEVTFTDKKLNSNESILDLMDYFTIALALVIVVVPEGLPLSLSIAMSFSIKTFVE